LTKDVFSFLLVYHFNALESETKLPFNIDYSNTIPKNYTVLGQRYDQGGIMYHLNLFSIHQQNNS